MKNWLYIPFLVLMAMTYVRVLENFSEVEPIKQKQFSRRPASLEVDINFEEVSYPSRFNSHYKSSN